MQSLYVPLRKMLILKILPWYAWFPCMYEDDDHLIERQVQKADTR